MNRDRDVKPAEPRPIAGRLPPHNLDAEAACISAALLSAEAADELAGALPPEDCYSDANKQILGAICELRASGKPADIVTVANVLRERGTLNGVGGPAYLTQLVDAVPAVAHLGSYITIVRDHARVRRMIATCQHVAAEGYFEHGPTQAWLDSAALAVETVATSAEASTGEFIGAGIARAFRRIQDAASSGRMSGWSTGLRDLDRRLGGLEPGAVTIVGGRPSMGKTSLALGIAEAVAEQEPDGERLGAFVASLEMPREQVAKLRTFARARVNSAPLKEGRDPGERAWRNLAAAASELSRLPLWIDDAPGISPLALRSKVRAARADFRRRGVRLACVVVDYLQLMSAPGLPRGTNREQEVAHCSKKLKELAKELEVHVVALSQLNRGVEARGMKDRRPRMSDLRESGSVEQDADNIVLVYREDYYNPDCGPQDKGIAELLIEKQRAGERGVVKVRFTDWCTRFDNLEGWTEREGAEA